MILGFRPSLHQLHAVWVVLGTQKPYKHKDPTFWFWGLKHGGVQKPCFVGSFCPKYSIPYTKYHILYTGPEQLPRLSSTLDSNLSASSASGRVTVAWEFPTNQGPESGPQVVGTPITRTPTKRTPMYRNSHNNIFLSKKSGNYIRRPLRA